MSAPLRTIGLLGGMSWESTKEYYRIINEVVRDRCGGLASAPLLLHSFNFAEIAELQHHGQWNMLEKKLAQAAHGLQQAGAQAIVICTNLMHKVAPAIEEAIHVPLLHIADAVGHAAQAHGQQTLCLLGTRYTMQEPFYRERLARTFGIQVLIPSDADCQTIHTAIYDELCQGIFSDQTRAKFLTIIDKLAQEGAQGVVLGCTEIELLIGTKDTPLTLYPTAQLHALAAADFVMGRQHSSDIQYA